jgi:hypothetical protein
MQAAPPHSAKLRPADLRYVYRPARQRSPEWLRRIWGWF